LICSFLPRHSVYVGQVDYSATPEELLKHFEACGTVERVTIVWCVLGKTRQRIRAYVGLAEDRIT
jgi:polyadenylate-binding protein 2